MSGLVNRLLDAHYKKVHPLIELKPDKTQRDALAKQAKAPADAADPNVCVHGRREKCITCGWAPFKK